MSKVFLTGATGFIGGNLVNYLLEDGYEVKVLIRDKKHLENYSWKDKVEIIKGDILTPETFEGKMNDCDVIIHSAALISFWEKAWEKTHEVNVIGTKNIVLEALKVKPKKFIHISSVAAIGISEDGNPINETHPYNWTPYNISYMETKHLAEKEVFKGIEKGLNACIVNPANVWGAGDYRARRAKLVKAIKCRLPFYIKGATNFVDVKAVCKAINNAIEKGKAGERYILGGENMPVKDFMNIIADEVKTRRPFILVPKPLIAICVYIQEFLAPIFNFTPKPCKSQLAFFGPEVYYDSSKAIRELDMPVISISKCIQETVSFYEDHNLI